MKKFPRIAAWSMVTGYFFVCYLFLSSNVAHAYIDPSAVTYIIQAVAAVFIAIGAFLTIFRHKIAAFFKKGKSAETKREVHFTEEEPETGDSSEDNAD